MPRTDCRDCHKPRDGAHKTYCLACFNVRRVARTTPEIKAQNARRKSEWRKEHPCDYRTWKLKAWYGMTPEDYDAMLASQHGVCAICRQACKTGRRLAIDHDHACCPGDVSCGECVRGLLCGNCNHALGKFSDDPKVLEAAIRYLKGR